MESIEIAVGQSQRRLRLEPQQKEHTYRLYAVDPAEDWFDHEGPRSVDLPADGSLGTMTIRGENDFDFDGAGAFAGQELQGIAAQVIRHPSF